MSHVVVFNQSAKTVRIATNPTKYLTEVRDEACDKFKVRKDQFTLKYNNKPISLSQQIRLANLPQGARLELVQASRSPTVISVALQLPESEKNVRLTKKFASNTSLWEILRQFESTEGTNYNFTQRGVPEMSGTSGAGRLNYEMPVITVMPGHREQSSFVGLQQTLTRLGFDSGSALLRLSFRNSGRPLEEAMAEITQYFAGDKVKATEDEKDPDPKPEKMVMAMDPIPGPGAVTSTLNNPKPDLAPEATHAVASEKVRATEDEPQPEPEKMDMDPIPGPHAATSTLNNTKPDLAPEATYAVASEKVRATEDEPQPEPEKMDMDPIPGRRAATSTLNNTKPDLAPEATHTVASEKVRATEDEPKPEPENMDMDPIPGGPPSEAPLAAATEPKKSANVTPTPAPASEVPVSPVSSPQGARIGQNVQIYAAPTSATPQAARRAYNEADYVPTVEHAKSHQASLQARTRNQRLLSDKELADLENARQEKLKAIAEKGSFVRIRLPDQTMLETSVSKEDTAESLYAFVEQYLQFRGEPFQLKYRSPDNGRQASISRDKKRLIQDLRFTVKEIITFLWDENASSEARLSRKTLAKEWEDQAQTLKVEEPVVEEKPASAPAGGSKAEGKKKASSSGVDKESKLKSILGKGLFKR